MKKTEKNLTKIVAILSLFALFLPLSISALDNVGDSANPKPKLFVGTTGADKITQTSATLHGEGGISFLPGCTSLAGFSATTGSSCSGSSVSGSNSTLPITAYFRYS